MGDPEKAILLATEFLNLDESKDPVDVGSDHLDEGFHQPTAMNMREEIGKDDPQIYSDDPWMFKDYE